MAFVHRATSETATAGGSAGATAAWRRQVRRDHDAEARRLGKVADALRYSEPAMAQALREKAAEARAKVPFTTGTPSKRTLAELEKDAARFDRIALGMSDATVAAGYREKAAECRKQATRIAAELGLAAR